MINKCGKVTDMVYYPTTLVTAKLHANYYYRKPITNNGCLIGLLLRLPNKGRIYKAIFKYEQ